jgi:hypothetical protein
MLEGRIEVYEASQLNECRYCFIVVEKVDVR